MKRIKTLVFLLACFSSILVAQSDIRIDLTQPLCDVNSFEIKLVYADAVDLDLFDITWFDNQMDVLMMDTSSVIIDTNGMYIVQIDSAGTTILLDTIEIIFPEPFIAIDDVNLDCDISSVNMFHGYDDDRFRYEWEDLANGPITSLTSDAGYQINDSSMDGGTFEFELTYIQIDSFLQWSTMDTMFIKDTTETICFKDTFEVAFKYSAIPIFTPINACFGNDLMILNTSIPKDQVLTVNYHVDSTGYSVMNIDSTIMFPTFVNGDSSNVYISINQANGCNTEDTVKIISRLVPTADFILPDGYCENAPMLIENASLNTSSNSEITLNQGLETWDSNSSDLELGNTIDSSSCETEYLPFSPGMANLEFVVTNMFPDATCSDDTTLTTIIYDVTEISIDGLPQDTFCQNIYDGCNDDLAEEFPLSIIYCLDGQPTNEGVIFPSQNIFNSNNGMAIFKPEESGQFVISADLTDSNGCVVTHQEMAEVIPPDSNVSIDGLDDEYCSESGIVVINGMPSGGEFLINVNSNDSLIMGFGSEREFEPLVDITTDYIFTYEKEDNNGCKFRVCDSTTVFPLPNVDLPDLVTITNGVPIEIGIGLAEPMTTYLWSTGEMSSIISVENPGFYSLAATTTFPPNGKQCMDSDTIQITILNSTLNLESKISIYPNPFASQIFIEDYPADWIKPELYSLNGKSVLTTIIRAEEKISMSLSEYISTGYYLLRFPNGQAIKLFHL